MMDERTIVPCMHARIPADALAGGQRAAPAWLADITAHHDRRHSDEAPVSNLSAPTPERRVSPRCRAPGKRSPPSRGRSTSDCENDRRARRAPISTSWNSISSPTSTVCMQRLELLGMHAARSSSCAPSSPGRSSPRKRSPSGCSAAPGSPCRAGSAAIASLSAGGHSCLASSRRPCTAIAFSSSFAPAPRCSRAGGRRDRGRELERVHAPRSQIWRTADPCMHGAGDRRRARPCAQRRVEAMLRRRQRGGYAASRWYERTCKRYVNLHPPRNVGKRLLSHIRPARSKGSRPLAQLTTRPSSQQLGSTGGWCESHQSPRAWRVSPRRLE